MDDVKLQALIVERNHLLYQLSAVKRQIKRYRKQLGIKGPLPRSRRIAKNTDQPKTRYVYALKCENGYFYVGQTTSVRHRFKQHLEGTGAWFTKLHKPLSVIEQHELLPMTENEALEFEDELAYQYIRRYGLEKVRGGRFIQRDEKWFRKDLEKRSALAISQELDTEMLAAIARSK